MPLAFRPEHEARLERLRDRLGALDGKCVVEPGCGAGVLTVRLAEWVGADGHVWAFDSSEGMLSHARRFTEEFPQVLVEQADAETVEMEEGSWDLILCFRFYPHLKNPRPFLQKCRRALATDGQLVIANLEGSARLNEIHGRHAVMQGDIMPDAETLKRQLEADRWMVMEAIDEEDEFFLRAVLL
ncbi:MAG: class I SAM-dependent methyltransferase [Verrucomicrobiota bacterium]|nr:class I SAM-dependent methyltransferase [Verrucomicrobiota bacterium]